MILSILIPTVREDAILLARLLDVIKSQTIGLEDRVEVIIDNREQPTTTGEKRNDLISKAQGKYTVFVDSDDLILNDYVTTILDASVNDSDCICFRGFMTTHGANREDFVLRLGEKYENRGGVYYRWPNHITPIKREISSKVRFPHVTNGEDYQWSKQIRDMGLIKTETFINQDLYYYDCRPRPNINMRRSQLR